MKAKGIISLIIVIVFFTSCGTRKTVTDTQISQVVNERIEEAIKQIKKERAMEVHSSLLSGNIHILETEYDTDKPVSSETGKPPVKKQTDTILNFDKKDSLIINNEIDTNTDKLFNSDKKETTNIENTSKIEKKESKQVLYLSIFLICIIILVIIYLLNRAGFFKKQKSSLSL